jgi:hypothetical protein
MKRENASVDAINATKKNDACPTFPSESQATAEERLGRARLWKHLSK